MKKIVSLFTILFILGIIFSFVGCSNISIDEKLISTSENSLKGFVPKEDTLSIDTYPNKYVVNIEHGIEQLSSTYSFDNGKNNKVEWQNIQKITSSDILETVSESKRLIINYINESSILKDKETLISFINDLHFKSADFPDESLIAAFDSTVNTVFINTKSNLVDTHTIVHELFHALASKTREDSSKWDDHCTTIFDETFTEVLARSVIKPNYSTNYDNCLRYVYHYIGIFGENAIKGYFYGLDELEISSTEFHMYTIAVDVFHNSTSPEEINGENYFINVILSKWILEKNK